LSDLEKYLTYLNPVQFPDKGLVLACAGQATREMRSIFHRGLHSDAKFKFVLISAPVMASGAKQICWMRCEYVQTRLRVLAVSTR